MRTPPGAPVPPGSPTRPIVHAASGPEEPPRVWGRPPTSPQPRVQPREPEREPYSDGSWAGASDAQAPYSERDAYQDKTPTPGQDAYPEREDEASSTGPLRLRETSGVQVRLGPREREEERRARRRAGRHSGLVAAGVLALAGLVTIGLVLTRGPGDGDSDVVAGERRSGAGAGVRLPAAGAPIEIGTADGSRYRLATVTSGVSDGAVTTFQSTPPAGTAFPYIEYMLGNPTNEKVLLDFPGDVFVKRGLVTPQARGRCMPQAGVPEDMCTPPTKSTVVRRLAGGELIGGEGGDKYLAPGGTYLVRATVDVPVKSGLTRKDMGLYVWKQLYMADQLAKQVPFPG